MVTRNGAFKFDCALGQPGGWFQLFVTALLAFHIGYTRIHLATEMHLDDALSGLLHGSSGIDEHGAPGDADHEEDEGHMPHPASDHALVFTAPDQVSGGAALTMDLLPTDILVSLHQTESLPRIPVFERARPPGESPPGPRQPRGPPFA